MLKPTSVKPVHEETTYQLLVDSEEKVRGTIEGFVYLLLMAATAVTIWQFSREPATVANLGLRHAEKIANIMEG